MKWLLFARATIFCFSSEEKFAASLEKIAPSLWRKFFLVKAWLGKDGGDS